ncbi:DUF6545 domain-containing protein [Pseudonocardia sp. D17]|uniref:DUF6545 domain-containing protein n=1 Tax=Pseudonocardia sp. D17 TaxID=882661 RepID=UPI002B3F6E00|nr:hypothetical protein PSD17_06220 [Pseudonocardia sp. D17]
MTLIEAATAVVLLLAAAWEWRQFVVHPRDVLAGDQAIAVARTQAVGLTGIGLVVALSLPIEIFKPAADFIHDSFVTNVVWNIAVYCYSACFLIANADESTVATAKRQANIEFLGVMVATGLMYVAVATAPHSPRIAAGASTWQNILYYLGVAAYPVVVWVIGTTRALTKIRRLTHVWARPASIMMVIGVSAMVLGVDGVALLRQGLYIAIPGSKWPVLRTWYNVGRLGGQLLLAVGLVMVPIAGAVYRAKEWLDLRAKERFLHGIDGLWSRLTAEFPHVVLPPVEDDDMDDVETRFDLRTGEITGGLAELAPYCSHQSVSGMDRPDKAAVIISEALARVEQNRTSRWAGDEVYPARLPPYPLLEPDFGGRWRKRAAWMAGVSRVLADTGLGARGRGPEGELRRV